MKNFYKLLTKMDYTLLISLSAVIVLGLFVLDSAAASKGTNYVLRQGAFIGVGFAVVLGLLRFDYTILKKYSKYFYLFALLFLLAVRLFGQERGGARGWFMIGSFGIQPAEYCKILIIISYAQFLSARREKLQTLKDLIPCIAFMVLPVLLLMAQPDWGSAMVYIFIMIGMLLVAGASRKWLIGLFGGGVTLLVIYLIGVWKFNWWCPLEKYALNRFLVLFDSSIDPLGAGYNVWQSKIAIGNGGLWGEGLHMGSQSTGAFMPEQWTDFIFAVFAEELGFIGACTLLLLYAVMLFRGLRISMLCKDLFGALVAAGVVSMYLFHILENVGMTMGLMPVTGIPLPFVSYGGSAVLTNLIGIALLQNIYVHRQRLIF